MDWIGREWIPSSQGALLLIYTATLQDVEQFEKSLSRQLIIAVGELKDVKEEQVLEKGFLFLEKTNKEEAVRWLQDKLRSNTLVGIILRLTQLPEGNVTSFPQFVLDMIEHIESLVIPVWIDSFWNNFFSPLDSSYPSTSRVIVGAPKTLHEDWRDWLRKSFYDLSSQALLLRPEIEENIGWQAIYYLKQRKNNPIFIDGHSQKVLTGKVLLGIALRVASWISKNITEPRIGVLLPIGAGAIIINLAVVLAGKIPVNFNMTAGSAMNLIAIEKSKVKTLFSAKILREKLQDFPWPKRTIETESFLKSFSKLSFFFHIFIADLLPPKTVATLWGIPKRGANKEAILLFTSGSFGEPKGVPLSHKNILANIAQIKTILSSIPIKKLLGALPIFHSFGSTTCLWWPILGGPLTVSYVNPLEIDKLATLIEQYQIELLITTPTFLRQYVKKVPPEKLRSLKIVITGSEKLQRQLAADFESKFGIPVCEGYGTTEASPVISSNVIDPFQTLSSTTYNQRNRPGSVGQLAAGISIRIFDQETLKELTLSARGILSFKGANIFGGYLDDPLRTAASFRDGWYVSGDVGSLDNDGFLYIEDRVSRFSKIGGEMVPHGTIEEGLRKGLQEVLGEDFEIAVVGIPDIKKGETLAVLINRKVYNWQIRKCLVSQGFSRLWIPKHVLVLNSLPKTPLGKIDYQRCRLLASKEEIQSTPSSAAPENNAQEQDNSDQI
ncbi:AMP-binding protein [Methylacidiphilum caldifontis]|uniref:AMP-binding protein n=1 Tax=Methylacidiphilum caldifontis TaxID=2795386 RepID=UPI001A8CDF58|nr:AMP-binding protein [Methylacidiphilum caldifontis]QSR88446.1 AMP-binding protein [Methylacidiphilum caldifontis]